MRVLLICDDYWHPGEVPIKGSAPLKEKDIQLEIITDANKFSHEMLKDFPVVILSKCDEVSHEERQSWKTEAVQNAFVAYVESGGGLIAVHTGTVPGKNTEVLDRLLGCHFITHPHDCPVMVQTLKKHPVTEGVEVFCEIDEHYRMEILESDTDILAASYSAAQGEESKRSEDPYNNTVAAICPAVMTRTQGKGRVCVLTPGHKIEVWENDNFQKLLKNAIDWCSGKTS